MPSEAAYTPGSWVAVGAEAGWLLVETDPADPMVLTVWSLLRGGADIDEILDAVLRRGLRSVGDFALVRVSGQRRAVVVRGRAVATITSDGDDEPVSAEGMATWREHPLPAAASAVVLRSSGDTGYPAGRPLAPGITLASSIRLVVTDAPPAREPRPDDRSDQAEAEVQVGAPPQAEAPAPVQAEGSIPWLAPPDQPPAAPGPEVPPVPPPPAPPRPQPAERAEAEPPPQPQPAEPDSMAWLAAVKPLGPPADDSEPYRNGPPTAALASGISSEAAPSAPPEPEVPSAWSPPPPPQPGPGPADSPDSTISRASLMEQPAPSGHMVQAVRCQHGHLSPPMAVSCRVCGFPLMGQAPVTVPRPTLGVLRLSTGDVVPLDRTVIMGRNPKSDEGNEAERPHVVRLPSPGHDISRTHVEIRLDGWHVLLTDLNSVNGTIVTPPWQEPQRLRPNEAVPIEPGTVVGLADEVTFRYEVTG